MKGTLNKIQRVDIIITLSAIQYERLSRMRAFTILALSLRRSESRSWNAETYTNTIQILAWMCDHAYPQHESQNTDLYIQRLVRPLPCGQTRQCRRFLEIWVTFYRWSRFSHCHPRSAHTQAYLTLIFLSR